MATALVVLSDTNGIRGTSKFKADGHTFRYSQNIRPTRSHLMAVVVGFTFGQSGFLAARGLRIPNEVRSTITNGIIVGIQLANLVLSTSDCGAGINTRSETSRSIDATNLNTRTILVSLAVAHWLTRFWFATRGQVARIPEETLGANARRSVVVGHAQGIRSTLNFATRIHTLSNSASEWEANLLVVALLVVCTLSENCAAV